MAATRERCGLIQGLIMQNCGTVTVEESFVIHKFRYLVRQTSKDVLHRARPGIGSGPFFSDTQLRMKRETVLETIVIRT